MSLIFLLFLSFTSASASSCNYLVEDFSRLSLLIQDNNTNQSGNLDYVGNYLLNLHNSLESWEGRKVAVPKGQFNFLKQDGEMIKDAADSSFTVGKDIRNSLEALQKRLSECIKK